MVLTFTNEGGGELLYPPWTSGKPLTGPKEDLVLLHLRGAAVGLQRGRVV